MKYLGIDGRIWEIRQHVSILPKPVWQMQELLAAQYRHFVEWPTWTPTEREDYVRGLGLDDTPSQPQRETTSDEIT